MFSRYSASQRLDHKPREGQTFYFAYGSNLSFDQMVRRCPGSRFIGCARLYKYRFQINERGFANVVEVHDPQIFVDGLCYRLTEDDEGMLDRSEGVPTAYQKEELKVEFFPAPPSLLGRDVVDIVRNRDSSRLTPSSPFRTLSTSQDRQFAPFQTIETAEGNVTEEVPSCIDRRYALETRGVAAMAMVYLSTRYVKDGRPWDEYIDRMEMGLQEALRLGISSAYVQEDVYPCLMVGRGSRTLQGEQSSARRSRTSRKVKEIPSSSGRDRARSKNQVDEQTQAASPDRSGETLEKLRVEVGTRES